MTSPNRKIYALGALLLAGNFTIAVAEMSVEATQTFYAPEQVSLEPEDDFLILRVSGGMTTEIRSYALRGDGQLTIFSNANASGTPQLIYTERLSEAEVESAVNNILSARLYEFDRAQVIAKHRDEPHPGPSIDDAGSLSVEIHLPLFPGTLDDGADELNHVFGVNLSDMAEGHFPSVVEYAALRQILGSVRRAERRARAAVSR